MPEVRLTLEWPDGRTSELYSPSTVILEHLRPGQRLPVAELQEKVQQALRMAAERVRSRYGFSCTRTEEEWVRVQALASVYGSEQIVSVR